MPHPLRLGIHSAVITQVETAVVTLAAWLVNRFLLHRFSPWFALTQSDWPLSAGRTHVTSDGIFSSGLTPYFSRRALPAGHPPRVRTSSIFSSIRANLCPSRARVHTGQRDSQNSASSLLICISLSADARSIGRSWPLLHGLRISASVYLAMSKGKCPSIPLKGSAYHRYTLVTDANPLLLHYGRS